MVKLDLRYIEVLLEVVDPAGTKEIEIINGAYSGGVFNYLIIGDRYIVLEGEQKKVIPFSAVYIHVRTVADILARIVGNEIYNEGMHAIPEGEERKLLEKLLGF